MRQAYYQFLVVLVIGFALAGCKKGAESIAPDLHFTTLKDGASIWNTVTLDLSVSQPESIVKADILANGKLVASATRAPFAPTWNTQSVDDGTYELKAVITHRQGITEETSINVSVLNTLVEFKVNEDHLTTLNGGSDRGWIFLSSAQGTLLAIAELQNGQSYKLTNAGFDEGSFLLNEAYLRDGGASLDITTFMNVPRGHWTPAANLKDPAIVGRLTWHFKDSIDAHPYFASTTGDSQLFYEGGNSIQMKVTQTPSRLFIREIGEAVNHYNLIEGLTLNQVHTGFYTDINKPLLTNTFEAPSDAQRLGIRLYGFMAANKFDEYYELGVFIKQQDQVTIEYPGNDFSVYGSENLFNTSTYRINAFNPTKMIDITPLTAQVLFKDLGNTKASVATFGNFDVYVVGWGYASKFTSFSWSMLGGAGKSDLLKIPDFPQEIRNAGLETFDPPKLNFSNVLQVADYEVANDYPSYIQYVSKNGYNAPYLFGKRWKEETFPSSGYTNGRQKFTEVPTIKDRLAGRSK